MCSVLSLRDSDSSSTKYRILDKLCTKDDTFSIRYSSYLKMKSLLDEIKHNFFSVAVADIMDSLSNNTFFSQFLGLHKVPMSVVYSGELLYYSFCL